MPYQLPPLRPIEDLSIPFKGYQLLAKDFILSRRGSGLFLDCGLGKTLVTLAAIYQMNSPGHTLIIGPKPVVRAGWLNEIKKWNIPLRTKSFIVNENDKDLSRKHRLELYAQMPYEPPTIYFINRELIGDLIKNTTGNKKPLQWYFPTVICDEIQSFKSYKAQRFKAMKTVQPAFQKFVGLTGTPTPDSLLDLWSEVYLMDGGARLGPNITAFREAYFHPTLYVNNHPVDYEPNEGSEQAIYQKISDVVISMKNTLLNLPPITYNNVTVYLSPEEKKIYKTLLKEQVLEFEGVGKVVAKNRAVLYAKLVQLAAGTLYINDSHEYTIIHHKKLEMAEYIVNNTSGPVIIAYHFKSDLEMLQGYFPQATAFDNTAKTMADWNAGKIPILLFQPASSSQGLNLQDGGHTLIWYSMIPNLENYMQTNARLHRQGQKHPVVIHHLLTEGTIDPKTLTSLRRKEINEESLLEAVRVVIDEALAD